MGRVRRVLKKPYKQNELASALGVKTNTLNNWFHDKRNTIPWVILLNFSQNHKIPFDWLLTGKPPEHGQDSLFSAEALSRYGFLEKIVAEVNEAARIGLSEETAVGNLIDEMRKVRRSLQDIKKTAESGKAE